MFNQNQRKLVSSVIRSAAYFSLSLIFFLNLPLASVLADDQLASKELQAVATFTGSQEFSAKVVDDLGAEMSGGLSFGAVNSASSSYTGIVTSSNFFKVEFNDTIPGYKVITIATDNALGETGYVMSAVRANIPIYQWSPCNGLLGVADVRKILPLRFVVHPTLTESKNYTFKGMSIKVADLNTLSLEAEHDGQAAFNDLDSAGYIKKIELGSTYANIEGTFLNLTDSSQLLLSGYSAAEKTVIYDLLKSHTPNEPYLQDLINTAGGGVASNPEPTTQVKVTEVSGVYSYEWGSGEGYLSYMSPSEWEGQGFSAVDYPGREGGANNMLDWYAYYTAFDMYNYDQGYGTVMMGIAGKNGELNDCPGDDGAGTHRKVTNGEVYVRLGADFRSATKQSYHGWIKFELRRIA